MESNVGKRNSRHPIGSSCSRQVNPGFPLPSCFGHYICTCGVHHLLQKSLGFIRPMFLSFFLCLFVVCVVALNYKCKEDKKIKKHTHHHLSRNKRRKLGHWIPIIHLDSCINPFLLGFDKSNATPALAISFSLFYPNQTKVSNLMTILHLHHIKMEAFPN